MPQTARALVPALMRCPGALRAVQGTAGGQAVCVAATNDGGNMMYYFVDSGSTDEEGQPICVPITAATYAFCKVRAAGSRQQAAGSSSKRTAGGQQLALGICRRCCAPAWQGPWETLEGAGSSRRQRSRACGAVQERAERHKPAGRAAAQPLAPRCNPCPPFAQPARPPLQVLRSWEEDQGDGSSRQLSYHDLVTHMFAVLKQLRLKLDTQPTDGPVW
jgi:hypothetical protein